MGKFRILCPGSGVLSENVTKITYKKTKRSDLSQQVTTGIQHVSIRTCITTVMHNNLFG